MGSFKVAGGEARFQAEMVREGDTLIFRGAHIEGDATKDELYKVAEQYGREQGVSKVIIEGGKRTTGARAINTGVGRAPRPITIEVK